MSDISLSNLDDNNDEVPAFVPPTTSPITGKSGIHGDVDAIPVSYKWVSVIQAVGPNSAKFPKDAGGILYDSSTIVPRPAEVSFFEIDIRYRQNLAYDPTGPRPQVFTSSVDVLANGGNLAPFVRAGVDDNNYVPEALACVVFFVVKGKKGWADKLDFKIENGAGVILVPAFWSLRGTAYRELMPKLRVAEKKALAAGQTLASARFQLDTDRKMVGNNWVYVPTLVALSSNDEGTVKLLDSNFGNRT